MPLATLLAALLLQAGPADPTLRAGQATAVSVDGVLDEADWATAEVATAFTQYRPTEGAAATHRTEVRVLRGPSSLFVGAVLHDDGEVRTTLSRRDDLEGDFFLVALDGYHEARSAYEFAVTASNVQFDAVNSGNNEDASWDAVWTSATRVTSDGWVAELEIPYSQLRFAGDEAAWGVNFVRMIRRLEEQTFWRPRSSQTDRLGLTAFLGTLTGVEGVRPQRLLQVTPYSLARARRYEGASPDVATADYAAEVGADVKVGLASNVILDLTVNPDFGQVDADPSELNLSTYETFFSERRPFFLEGTEIFDVTYGSGDGALLYTRRIGAVGPILGAAKLTGRTAGGLSFGALAAATGDDVDPERGYAAVRVKKDLPHQSYVGLGATGFVAGADAGDARSAAVAADWAFRVLKDHGWQFEGTAAATAVDASRPARPGDRPNLGYAVYIGFDNIEGFTTPGFGFRVYSDGFQLNDVGRFREADLISLKGGTSHLWNQAQPVGPFRRLRTGGFATQEWRYTDGTNRGFSGNLSVGGPLLSFQELDFGIRLHSIGGYDVRETRGLDVVVNNPRISASAEFETDQRRQFQASVGLSGSVNPDGGYAVEPGAGIDWTVSDRLAVSLDGTVSLGEGQRAWVTNEGFVRTADGLFVGAEAEAPDRIGLDDRIAVPLAGPDADALFEGLAPVATLDDGVGFYRPVFAARDTRSASLTSRANVLFSSTLSLQLYGQLFAARGRYQGFRLLAGPDDLRDFDAYPRRRDFSFATFNLNAVLRWEYRPGSSLYVVWTQARGLDDYRDTLLSGDPFVSPYDRSTTGQFGDIFGAFPDNVVLVKLSYLFMR